MSAPVHYSIKDSIAVLKMDDGKVNALGPTMQQALNDAIDTAEADDAGALVITGNDRVFSGGFDLKILTSGEVQPAIDMLRGGFELAYRLLSFPKPVVMACTGHAIAMGAFLLSAGDHRVAAHAYNIQANEVAIGMVIPYAALEIMKLRLTPSAYQTTMSAPKRSSTDWMSIRAHSLSPALIGLENTNRWSTWTITSVSMPMSTCRKKSSWTSLAKIVPKVRGATIASWPSSAAASSSKWAGCRFLMDSANWRSCSRPTTK